MWHKSTNCFYGDFFPLCHCAGRKRFEQFVPDSVLFKMKLENGGAVRSPVSTKTLGKFLSVASLDTFDGNGKGSDQVLNKLYRDQYKQGMKWEYPLCMSLIQKRSERHPD